MKSVDLFCASPASTAICSSTDQRSMVRQGTRHIERQGQHRLGGSGRSKPRTPIPCSSEIPISPRTYFERNRRNSSSKETELLRRKSSADVTDLSTPRSSRYLLSDNPIFKLLAESEHPSSALVPSQKIKHLNYDDFPIFRSSSARSHDSPVYQLPVPSSARSSHDLHGYKSPLSLPCSTDSYAKKPLATSKIDSHAPKSLSVYKQDSPAANKASSLRSREQVVELRVSIHCKGCEGKIRKHISRMEGVTSFSTDLATKKVTVIGNVSPLGVLTSISKVKYAEFWETPTSSSSSSASSSSS